eukprot:CAMPEP_0194705314 /NCGR_PEP_ID=MMETSP0295-20121207/28850_1 /TAXON_ID=39354 /ORGANISM="Heterosigma akashiwo, Strain CCMP2393" /LENGTH=66 /DNA_ID=CAMNT_0039600957 /DNA_START=98 /DNA_END=298 /DNA_ORIENTATION=+
MAMAMAMVVALTCVLQFLAEFGLFFVGFVSMIMVVVMCYPLRTRRRGGSVIVGRLNLDMQSCDVAL